ncbi:MAG: hypothetical protein KZQ85_12320 [Candidatus Thiodiazotropha sp. (ex Myrtea sp. 'scaly one' KF741663)]|nr:hypothetical protein [Candidatus Thiodiazotropha sp. (ex Myrtea sp. 'scaly one' KF741663)]
MNKAGVMLVLSLLSQSAFSDQISIEEGKRFFDNYQAQDAAYDPAFIELFTDDSRIRSLRRYPTGQEKLVHVNGAQWKSLLHYGLPIAKSTGDRSEFSNPRYEKNGKYLRIRADRHSLLRCFIDYGFYLDIERRQNGNLYIREMYLESQPHSKC